jgi:hypothetical protein
MLMTALRDHSLLVHHWDLADVESMSPPRRRISVAADRSEIGELTPRSQTG